MVGRVNDAARVVLSRAGYEVIVPERQGCCGALQAHSGDLAFAHGSEPSTGIVLSKPTTA